jgi:hypothetical protein
LLDATQIETNQIGKMHEQKSLAAQANVVSQLIDDAVPLLEKYKKTKSQADGDRYDEQVSQVATHWHQLLESYGQVDDKKIKESYEKTGENNIDKQTVLHNMDITRRWALEALYNYKHDVDKGFDGKIIAAHFFSNPKQLAIEMKEELTYYFRD